MVITLIPGAGSSLGIGTPQRGVVAKIGDEEVSVDDVQREAKAMIRQQLRNTAQAAMLLPYFEGQAAEQLINQKMLIAEAHRMGLRVSDDELRDELQHGQYSSIFFPDGKFVGQEEYENMLQRADLTVPQFEAQEKNGILIRKLRALVASSAFVGDSEVRDEFLRRNTKIKFEYAVLTQSDILKGLHPTEPELKAYYDRNKATYRNSIPEKRQIQYVVIDASKLGGAAAVTDKDLQSYYDQHRDEYRVPEQVTIRHILIKTPVPGADGKVDQKAVEEARKKADDVLKQLNAGAKFEDMARKYSEDPSAKDGGLVGPIQPSRFPSPDVQKAAETLPVGGTSGVINAGYAFVILHIEGRQKAQVKALVEVKSEIETKVKQEKVARASEVAANALLSQARTDGLDKAAAAKGMQAISTDYFGRSESLPGLVSSPQLTDAIFNEGEKAPPDVVQVPQGYVVFQVLGVRPPATPTFEEIRSRVESEFKNERAALLLQQKTQELSDRAKAEHDLKKAAKELGATIKTSDPVLPDGQVPDVGSMSGAASVIFSLNPGQISGPINTGSNGIVAQVLDRQLPTEQEFADKKDQIRQSLLQTKQEDLFGLFVSNLRKEMEKSNRIKVNQEEMKNLTRQPSEQGS
jgi:peptidyl-prolyl cis-trans isomerase D